MRAGDKEQTSVNMVHTVENVSFMIIYMIMIMQVVIVLVTVMKKTIMTIQHG
jgi:hypothetical protein